MSTLEETVINDSPALNVKLRIASLYSQLLKLLCSPRLGLALLCLMGGACVAGMLVMQQNVDGFDRYFADLSPWKKTVYSELGFFDIYHSWYFNALLGLLSLNIVLASVDRFPKTWAIVSRPRLTVPVRWLREQSQTAEMRINGPQPAITTQMIDAMHRGGWSKAVVSERDGVTYVFAQKGAWNRLGAYAVHLGLLTIFAGGFISAQLASGGQLPLAPGETTSLITSSFVDRGQSREITKQLPFEIACIDLQQKLIKKSGPLSAQNTIDWVTRFTITDDTGRHDAVVQMNQPFDYRGYRFFQSSFTPVGRARNITISARPVNGGGTETLTISRDGSAELSDGTSIRFNEFRGNFRIAPENPAENTTDYKNPAAVLQVRRGNAESQTAYGLIPGSVNAPLADHPVGGYVFKLLDFEKVADQHVLSVQRDPGANVVYVGFVLLFISISGVFFFSHQRVWAAIEQRGDQANIVFGGHTNRNTSSFDERFNRFISDVKSKNA